MLMMYDPLNCAGSANLHGPGTIALKAARSERRTEHVTPDEVADVTTPLTVSSSKEDVLFTIGAPLDSKQKPSRLHSLSPVRCTAKLGVCMLEPAPMPQAMMTGCAGDTRSNTATSSPEHSGVFTVLVEMGFHCVQHFAVHVGVLCLSTSHASISACLLKSC
jgi:hypothetical protein